MQFNLSGAMAGLATHGPPFSLNFTTSARIRGVFSLHDLQAAMEKLRRLHPLMAVRIDPGLPDQTPFFTTENVPPIPVRVVERQTDQDWVREVEQEIAIPTDHQTGPTFRCVCLKGKDVADLVLVSDHISADGQAGIYALRDLLKLLADPELSVEPGAPPRLGDLVPPAMREMILTKTSTPNGEPAAPPRERPPNPQVLPPLRVIPIEFSREETAALVDRCHKEGTTVQSALCAAFALPFAERQPDQPLRCIETPYNLRGRLTRPVDNVYGVFISLVYSEVDCAPARNRWDIARAFGRSLASVTDEQLFSIPIVMMQVAEGPLPMRVIGFDYDVSISNLGRVNIPAQYGSLSLETIFAPTMNVTHAGHRILGVTTFEGCMRCTFTSRDPQAPALVHRSREILAEMTRNQGKG